MPDTLGKFALWAPIQKIDAEQRMVWGWASTETKDLQGDIVKADAVEAALPDYMEYANIREMHRPSAVGVAKEAAMAARDDGGRGLWLGAKIVDDEAWKKVTEEVYKGFSIGGEKLAKVGNAITELRMVEISLVDRPANPDCRIELVKVAGALEDSVSHPEEDEATLAVEPEMTIPAKAVVALLKGLGFEKIAERKDTNPKEGEEKYGSDAHFADPKNKKYPLDSEKHIRAAWSYINMPKNASKYSSTDLATIKSRIHAAMKRIGADVTEKAVESTSLDKSMWTVSNMAQCYEALRSVKQSLKDEAMWEGDSTDSGQAEKVSEILQLLADLMSSKIEEEAKEENEGTDEDDLPGAGAMAMQAEATDLQKRFNKAHKAALSKVADHLNKAMACHEEMGKCFGKCEKADKKPAVDMAALQDAHERMGDHLDVAASHVEKLMKGINPDETSGHESDKSDAEMEKAATATGELSDEEMIATLAKNPAALRKYLATRDAAIRSEATSTVEAREVRKAAEAPATTPRARLYSPGKNEVQRDMTGFAAAPVTEGDVAEIRKGIEAAGTGYDMSDPIQRQAATASQRQAAAAGAGKLIGKMLTLPGKPGMGRDAMFDPTFHGKAGAQGAQG